VHLPWLVRRVARRRAQSSSTPGSCGGGGGPTVTTELRRARVALLLPRPPPPRRVRPRSKRPPRRGPPTARRSQLPRCNARGEASAAAGRPPLRNGLVCILVFFCRVHWQLCWRQTIWARNKMQIIQNPRTLALLIHGSAWLIRAHDHVHVVSDLASPWRPLLFQLFGYYII
jgi:hypothetical protein